MRLKDKVIVITGAASGIGYMAAKIFITEGAKLVLADINECEGMKLSSGLNPSCFVKTDVTSEQSVSKLFEMAMDMFGKIDGLFHNAGVESSKKLLECDEGHFDKVINTNLKGSFLCIREAAKKMLATGGSIVITASQRGLLASEGSIAYNASKGGAILLGKSAALELATFAIRVNMLCPGATDTPMFRRDMQNQRDPDFALAETLKKYPLGRLGTTEDMANAALYLLSDEASFVTGTTLVVDGGNIAGR